MSLPSGLTLALSSDALFDHGGNWEKCPDGHFWYWLPAPEIGSPPFDLLPGSAIMQMATHAPVPKDRNEVKRFIRVVEMRPDGEFGWRGEWLSTFPLYTKLTSEDLAAWNDWVASPETNLFLDKAIEECVRLSEVSRNAQGYALFVAAGQNNENGSKDDENRPEYKNWSQNERETWFREMRLRYYKYGGKYNKLLGVHPDKGGHVEVKFGPFGPYVIHDGVIATPPRGTWPEDITLDEAITLLDAQVKKLAAAKSTAKQPTPAQIAKAKRLARELKPK